MFGSDDNKHHFKNVLNDHKEFKEIFKANLCMSNDGWKKYWDTLKNFRNKRVAHVEPKTVVDFPSLDVAFKCVNAYYIKANQELKAKSEICYGDPSLDALIEKNKEDYSRDVSKIFDILKAT